MLFACMRAELMKLKRSFIWSVFLILPVISTIMGCFNYIQNTDIVGVSWYSLWTQTTLFYSNFFYAPLIAVYCAYLWRLENFNRNRNALLAAPVPIPCLYLAQFLAISCVTLLTQLWVGVLFLICGLITGLQGFPPLDTIIWLLRGCVGGLASCSFPPLSEALPCPLPWRFWAALPDCCFPRQASGCFSLIPSCFWE